MSQLNNWSSDPSGQDCIFGPAATVTNPTLTDTLATPTTFTVNTFQFTDSTIPFSFTISGNNLLELISGIVGISPLTTIQATTSTTSDLTAFSQINFATDSTTGNIQINSTLDNMNNAGINNQVVFEEISGNNSPTLVTATSQCTNTGVNNNTVNNVTRGQITFNNEFKYGPTGINSMLTASNTASNTSTGTNNNTLGTVDGNSAAQVNFNIVAINDFLTVNASNSGSNDGTNSTGAFIANVNYQILRPILPSQPEILLSLPQITAEAMV